MSKVSAYSSLVAPTSGTELYAIDSSGNSRKMQLEDALKEVGGGAPASGALLTYSTTTSTAEWLVHGASGEVLTVVGGAAAWAAAADRVPAAPTSGGIMAYSTATSTTEWSKPTSGATLIGSSLGTPTWLAAGTSGQVLTITDAVPAWAAAPTELPAAPSSGAILVYSTAATSGAAWSKPTSGSVLVGSSLGIPTWTAAGAAGYLLQSTGSVAAWKSPIRYVSIVGFSSGGTLATGPCGYVQIPPDINGYNLTYVSAFHASTAASNGKTEINFVRERAGTSNAMLTSAVEVDSGAVCSSASASQALIDTTNDDVATGDIIELHVKVIPSASAPKGITGQLGFSLP